VSFGSCQVQRSSFVLVTAVYVHFVDYFLDLVQIPFTAQFDKMVCQYLVITYLIRDYIVEYMQIHILANSFAELNSPLTVAVVIQWRTPNTYSHFVGDN